jgi:hypothetical protein
MSALLKILIVIGSFGFQRYVVLKIRNCITFINNVMNRRSPSSCYSGGMSSTIKSKNGFTVKSKNGFTKFPVITEVVKTRTT